MLEELISLQAEVVLLGLAVAGWGMHWFYNHSKFHNDSNTGQWDKVVAGKPE